MEIRKMRQEGQVGLIVLLIAAVVLTIGVSVASRSVSEIRITEEEETSTEALNAAEGAIEDIMTSDKILTPGAQSITYDIEGQSGNCTIEAMSEVQNAQVPAGHSLEFNTAGAQAGSQLEISYIGSPALVITIFNTNAGGSVRRSAYDSVSRGNGFTNPIPSPWVLNLQSGDMFVRMKALYSTAELSVVPVGTWPSDPAVQMARVTCQGDDESMADRAIRETKSYAQLPSIFDYVLFSGSNLEK